jgi:hypothetical protein
MEEQNKNFKIEENFFFEKIKTLNFNTDYSFFLTNNFVSQKQDSDYYYFKLPFIIIRKIIDSMESNIELTSHIKYTKDLWWVHSI